MPPPTQLRTQLESAVIADLLGPVNGQEEIVAERTVRDRYLVGKLGPKGQSPLPEEDDFLTLERAEGDLDSADADIGEGVSDARTPRAVSMLPSSLGLSFVISGQAEQLQVTARWGRYRRAEVQDEAYAKKDGGYWRVWQREPVEATTVLALTAGRLPPWTPNPDQPDVQVQGLVRDRQGHWHITLFLVNGQQEPDTLKDAAWVFQPELLVQAPDGAAIFERRTYEHGNSEEELRALAMRYRRQVEFAVGHGVAVEADLDPADPTRALRLRTVVLPAYELPDTVTRDVPGLTVDMKQLAEIADGDFTRHLSPLLSAYGHWIDGLEARLGEPDLASFGDVAGRAIAHARRTLTRIRSGIDLLDVDPDAAQAFRFANQAMALQRVHGIYASLVRQGLTPDFDEVDAPRNHTWRTFQLAFLLLNLPALTDPTHAERTAAPLTDGAEASAPDLAEAVADLLWFPTGGGKTEAYLGVAAFAMAIRRLQGEVGGRSGHAGVAVLMRYTLRLLTLQQFQRAALLCACEHIRRQGPALWGSEPFRLGLWVGQRSTPNWTKGAAEAIKSLRAGGWFSGGTPAQLSNCPWCGKPIDAGKHIEVEPPDQGRGRTLTFCGDPLGQCEFSKRHSPNEGIPVVVVDEEIYRRLPTLIIATVDKFAQMPWNGRTAMLFGLVDGYCERHGYRSPDVQDSDSHPAKKRHNLPPAKTLPVQPLRPPDLIIQDELHLISGPLGTLVGLYETAVDHLASWELDGVRVHPKVIASTATIRRAGAQVHSLFQRHVSIFPPPGLDADDNFFARLVPPDEDHPGRRYFGIYAPGIRHKTALLRTYTAYLAAAQQLFESYGQEADPWMTLVGYFNSLRELGSMRRAVDDTVATRLWRMDKRDLAKRFLSPYGVEELTSRRSASQIPNILDRLEVKFDPAEEDQRKRKRDKAGRYPIDVLLATNMISVGVDVPRLGLMVTAGQPKNTAEYIQATSRVGRRHPGIVATVYNWTRPRDISHYERFHHYHATMYQHVEALSVTPFSPRALDRGLTAVFTSLVRLGGTAFNANENAQAFDRDHELAVAAVEAICGRAAQLDGVGVAEFVEGALAKRQDQWLARIKDTQVGARLGYKGRRDGTTVGLLKAPEQGERGPFTCLNSLRDVEPTINLILNDYGMDRGGERAWEAPQENDTTEAEA